jgi:hypothetical protein
MSSAPNSNPATSSGSDRNQAAWYIVAVATMSFVLAILLTLAIRNAIAHDYVYAALMLVIGPLLLLSIIVNARRVLRAIP